MLLGETAQRRLKTPEVFLFPLPKRALRCSILGSPSLSRSLVSLHPCIKQKKSTIDDKELRSRGLSGPLTIFVSGLADLSESVDAEVAGWSTGEASLSWNMLNSCSGIMVPLWPVEKKYESPMSPNW